MKGLVSILLCILSFSNIYEMNLFLGNAECIDQLF